MMYECCETFKLVFILPFVLTCFFVFLFVFCCNTFYLSRATLKDRGPQLEKPSLDDQIEAADFKSILRIFPLCEVFDISAECI